MQLAQSTEKHEKRFSSLTTPSANLVKEGATDDQEEGQKEGTTELNLEGVSNVGSEMDRVHIAEKNKAMAAKLKVLCLRVFCTAFLSLGTVVPDQRSCNKP